MVQTEQLLLLLFDGFVLGMIFVLVASGLTLIFGVLGVINFAHGDLLVLGTYVSWVVSTTTGSLLGGIVAAGLSVAAVGLLIERTTLRFTYGKDPILQFLLTLGIAEILREGIQIVWGRNTKRFPIPDWGTESLDFFFFTYPSYRVFIIALTAIMMLGLYLLLKRTDIGIVIRASFFDQDMANVLGINVERIFLIVFIIGSAMAGVAGAMIGPLRSVYPTLGVELLIPAFVVVIIGGLGSIRGSVVGGLIVGQILVISGHYIPGFSQVLVFMTMSIVLLIRPRGLFGKEGMFD